MSGVEQARQACRDAAANLWEKLNMPGSEWNAELMRDGTGDAGPVVCAFVGLWNKAYAAGRDAERGRSAAMLEALRAAEAEIERRRPRGTLFVGHTASVLLKIRAAIAAATEGGAG